MLGSLIRLVVYRFLGARVLLALAVFGWIRRALGGRREPSEGRREPPQGRRRSAYQPSQGESQTVQRDPR